jgi:hypothetical protein
MRSGLFLLSTIVGLCVAVPSFAQELDVRIGHRDHRGIARAHAEYGPGRAVVIRRERDHDRRWHRDWDHDRGVHRRIIIDR